MGKMGHGWKFEAEDGNLGTEIERGDREERHLTAQKLHGERSIRQDSKAVLNLESRSSPSFCEFSFIATRV